MKAHIIAAIGLLVASAAGQEDSRGWLWLRTVDGSTTTVTITTLGNASTNITVSVPEITPPRMESWYRDRLASNVHGSTEATCYLGRADVITSSRVYEVDWLTKHHEALGQALWYGWATGKKPTMALIVPLGEWRAFRAVKAFVESNSTVRVIALDEKTGSVMAEYDGGGR